MAAALTATFLFGHIDLALPRRPRGDRAAEEAREETQTIAEMGEEGVHRVVW